MPNLNRRQRVALQVRAGSQNDRCAVVDSAVTPREDAFQRRVLKRPSAERWGWLGGDRRLKRLTKAWSPMRVRSEARLQSGDTVTGVHLIVVNLTAVEVIRSHPPATLGAVSDDCHGSL